MYKIGYISDLHLDIYKNSNNIIKTLFKNNELDLLIISGDLAEKIQDIIYFLKEIQKLTNCTILYTFGNHELWDKENYNYLNLLNIESILNENKTINKKDFEKTYNFKNKIKDLKKEIKKLDNIYLLDGNIYNFNNIKILGIPMWYDFSYGINELKETKEEVYKNYKNYMYDSTYIMDIDPLKFFKEQYKKLESILQNEKEIDIIFSHVGPIIPKNLPNKYKNSIGNSFFYFDGKKILEDFNIKYWMFGHTHDKYNFIYNNTNLLCNPYGYPNEVNNPKLEILEISK